MSQDALARAVGMSRQHVFQVERGAHENMRMDTVSRYAEALGVSEQYLLSGHEAGQPGGAVSPEFTTLYSDLDDIQRDTLLKVGHALREAQERYAARPLDAPHLPDEQQAAFGEETLAQTVHEQSEPDTGADT